MTILFLLVLGSHPTCNVCATKIARQVRVDNKIAQSLLQNSSWGQVLYMLRSLFTKQGHAHANGWLLQCKNAAVV